MEELAAALRGILLYYLCNFPLQVIAIVTDSLTDLDIFKDLQEACSHRKVPVYILLDQSCAPAFLKMSRNVGVRLDDLQVCGLCAQYQHQVASNENMSLWDLITTGHSCSHSLSFSICTANESANHNWYNLLHEIGGEDYWESTWEVHADWWKQSGHRFLQVTAC